MSDCENLLDAIIKLDGQTVRDILIALPFERQLRMARKAQSINLTNRKNQTKVGEAMRVYAHFDLLGSAPEIQERLTIRLICGENKIDVYTIQRNLSTGRQIIYFKTNGAEARISLSQVEIAHGEFTPNLTPMAELAFGGL